MCLLGSAGVCARVWRILIESSTSDVLMIIVIWGRLDEWHLVCFAEMIHCRVRLQVEREMTVAVG